MQFQDEQRVIVNVESTGQRWIRILRDLQTAPWVLPRVYNVDNHKELVDAIENGAWAIATNVIEQMATWMRHQPFTPRHPLSEGEHRA
jgi:hypothetical protein